MMKNALLVLALAALSLAIGWRVFYEQPSTQQSQAAAIGGAFSLTDQNGKRVTEQDIKGRHALVFFGFTQCPDVCPTTLSTISRAMDALGDKAGKVTPVFISLDAQDAPAAMKIYLSNFHPSILGLTGTPEEIKAAAAAYRVYYSKVEQPETSQGYTIDHSAYIYFMDKNGQYITHFAYSDPAEKIAESLRPNL